MTSKYAGKFFGCYFYTVDPWPFHQQCMILPKNTEIKIMKYVDDLTKVKPEEIVHTHSKRKQVIGIVYCAKNNTVVVAWEDGSSAGYYKDGSYVSGGDRYFVYKPKKIKKLKPLHVVLAEHPGYEIDLFAGVRILNCGEFNIIGKMILDFGRTEWDDNYNWDESWFEEVEEGQC